VRSICVLLAFVVCCSLFGQPATSGGPSVGVPERQFVHPGGEFDFLPFEPSLIENLSLLGDSPVNLIVISNGNYVRKMNWLSPLSASVFDFYSMKASKTNNKTPWIIFSAASSEQPIYLVDGSKVESVNEIPALAKEGSRTIDLMAGTQANQDLIKLLGSFHKLIEQKGLKVEKIIFVISTEWNFSSLFNPGEPERSMKSLLDGGIEQIHIVQIHEDGKFGLNAEFDETLTRASNSFKGKVSCHKLPFGKIPNELKPGVEPRDFLGEIKKKMTNLFHSKIL